ncbi:MAG: hypothetical protein IPL46_14585 [Saprospiraceae bacterium]|nr:hypothetical protein [Saprospiraceae bacterium]
MVQPFELADAIQAEELCVLKPKLPILDKPKIGIGAPSDEYFMVPSEIEQIRILQFDHYHFEIDFSRKDWHSIWLLRVREAIAMQQDLEVFLIFSDNYLNEVHLFANDLDQLPAEVRIDLLILHRDYKSTPAFLVDTVIPILQKVKKDCSIGAGTATYFTELNRDRVKTQGLDFVSYSVNPQVHAFDNASMTENAQAQIYTVESAIKYFNDLPVHVAPITLKPRFNPNATVPESEINRELPDAVDLRQASLYGACWTLSSLVHLCASGANLLTYYETVGWKGIMQGSREPENPDLFPTNRDMLFPLLHIFQNLLRHKSTSWLPFEASLPYTVVALGIREGSSLKVLMANLSDTMISTQLQYPAAKHKYFIWDQNNLSDSYFDSEFLDKNLESISFNDQGFPRIKIAAHAIVYAQLLD